MPSQNGPGQERQRHLQTSAVTALKRSVARRLVRRRRPFAATWAVELAVQMRGPAISSVGEGGGILGCRRDR